MINCTYIGTAFSVHLYEKLNVFFLSWQLLLPYQFSFLLYVEYIVVFNGYYSASARSVFVRDALSSALDSWKIIPRHNPASDYPSDFSLVKVRFCFSSWTGHYLWTSQSDQPALTNGKQLKFLKFMYLSHVVQVTYSLTAHWF